MNEESTPAPGFGKATEIERRLARADERLRRIEKSRAAERAILDRAELTELASTLAAELKVTLGELAVVEEALEVVKKGEPMLERAGKFLEIEVPRAMRLALGAWRQVAGERDVARAAADALMAKSVQLKARVQDLEEKNERLVGALARTEAVADVAVAALKAIASHGSHPPRKDCECCPCSAGLALEEARIAT